MDDDLAALAVGILGGRDRAAVLRHLEGCPACAAELDALSAAADALLTLVPEEAPPPDFAARTAALMGPQPQAEPRRGVRSGHRPARWRLAAAAAAVVVALGVGLGVGQLLAPPAGSGGGARTAALVSPSGASGTVTVSPGRNGWLVMTIAGAPPGERVTCLVALADGSRQVVGRFTLSTGHSSSGNGGSGYGSSGHGSWAVRLPVAASSVRSVLVVDHQGRTVVSGVLPPAS